MSKTAQELISEKINEMPMDAGMGYKYVCMDTRMGFETYDEQAMYSPFTGSMNIEEKIEDDGMDMPMDTPMDTSVPMAPEPSMNYANGNGMQSPYYGESSED